jgi:predicted PurR-regulated permease PerM
MGDDKPRVLTIEGGRIVEYQPQWAGWVRQFVAIFLVIGCVVGVILLGPIAQILIASFLIALLMYFPARFLSRRLRTRYKLAVALLYLLLIGALLISIVSVIPLVARAINDLNRSATQTFGNTITFFRTYAPNGRPDYLSAQGLALRTPENSGLFTVAGLTFDADPALRPIRDALLVPQRTAATAPIQTTSLLPSLPSIDIQSILGVLTGILGAILGGVTGLASTGVLALFISFLILIELPTYERGLLRMIPPVYHRELGLLTAKVMRVWAGFFRGQLIVGLIIGVLTWLQLALMGIPGAIPLAIIVAIISLIPNIGGIIALLPLAIVPLLQGSTTIAGSNVTVALLVVGINLIISQIIWNVVAPSIIGDALNLPLPVIIIGVFLGAAIGGVVGAFLIAPILGMLRVIVMYLLMKIAQQDPFPGETWERNVIG